MLNEIHSPADLKKLDYDQLDQLAYELRREILQTVSRTGGHLSSNLGAVELTLALDYVLEENDRIFFDVGHQTYAQKLLTGRQELFRRIHALPEKTREVVYLRLSGELPFSEIGAILGESETWARVTFYRAKQKLLEGGGV